MCFYKKCMRLTFDFCKISFIKFAPDSFDKGPKQAVPKADHIKLNVGVHSTILFLVENWSRNMEREILAFVFLAPNFFVLIMCLFSNMRKMIPDNGIGYWIQ